VPADARTTTSAVVAAGLLLAPEDSRVCLRRDAVVELERGEQRPGAPVMLLLSETVQQ
jgi:hypothetical protein